MNHLKVPDATHEILSNGERQYKALKREIANRSASFAGGGSGRDVLSVIDYLQSAKESLQLVIDTPGTLQLAKDKYADQSYDVISNITTLVIKINEVIDDIVLLIPKNGIYMQMLSLNEQNKPVWRVFTGSQLAPLILKLDAVVALIA
jgi:hypothetical protein